MEPTKKAKLVTPVFRVSYPNVFKARMNDLSKKMEYSVEALFPKGCDLSALQKAVKDAIIDEWGDTAKVTKNASGNYDLFVEGKMVGKKGFRLPFKDQGDKEKDGHLPEPLEKGAIYLSLKSSKKPGVAQPFADPEDPTRPAIMTDENDFYAGCYAKASVNAKAYDQAGNIGVSIYLNNIQKVKDGEPLGGRTRAQDDFEAIEGASGDEAGSADNLFS